MGDKFGTAKKLRGFRRRADNPDGTALKQHDHTPMTDLSMEEIESDLAATERDVMRLSMIVANLEEFISDSGGEDRSGFRMDLFKYQGLREQAIRLKEKIAKVKHDLEILTLNQ